MSDLINDGGPAFPPSNPHTGETGMTLRDYVAVNVAGDCNAHYEMLDALKKVYYDMHIPELAQKTIEAAVIEATGGMP